jgi:hypothetical protein
MLGIVRCISLSELWLRRVYTVLLFVIAADLIRKLVS